MELNAIVRKDHAILATAAPLCVAPIHHGKNQFWSKREQWQSAVYLLNAVCLWAPAIGVKWARVRVRRPQFERDMAREAVSSAEFIVFRVVLFFLAPTPFHRSCKLNGVYAYQAMEEK